MKKNIYSLLLSESVMHEVDRLAYENGMSRSAMANSILADFVSYSTPEKRMREIFSGLESLLSGEDTLRMLIQPSDNRVALKSVLTYKYNPTVKYSVELYRSPIPAIGELRVNIRTQNAALSSYMHRFFNIWMAMEKSLIGETESVIDNEKYTRRLKLNEKNESTNITIGQAICKYICLFDKGLNVFFTDLNNTERATDKICYMMREYLAGSPVIM